MYFVVEKNTKENVVADLTSSSLARRVHIILSLVMLYVGKCTYLHKCITYEHYIVLVYNLSLFSNGNFGRRDFKDDLKNLEGNLLKLPPPSLMS